MSSMNIKLEPIFIAGTAFGLGTYIRFDIHVSPQAFPELHHLQQLALSVTDSSTDPLHSASLA